MKTYSEEYKELCKKHHKEKSWGVSDAKWIKTADRMANQTNSDTILDYGAGRGRMARGLRKHGYEVFEYDPAIEGKKEKPEGKFDFVASADVFEHIEPEYIDNVLEEINNYMKKAGFFVICLRKAKSHWLADGRNAHVLLKPKGWWIWKLKKYWNVTELEGRNNNRELVVFVEKDNE